MNDERLKALLLEAAKIIGKFPCDCPYRQEQSWYRYTHRFDCTHYQCITWINQYRVMESDPKLK